MIWSYRLRAIGIIWLGLTALLVISDLVGTYTPIIYVFLNPIVLPISITLELVRRRNKYGWAYRWSLLGVIWAIIIAPFVIPTIEGCRLDDFCTAPIGLFNLPYLFGSLLLGLLRSPSITRPLFGASALFATMLCDGLGGFLLGSILDLRPRAGSRIRATPPDKTGRES
jgi:hypothetical protein